MPAHFPIARGDTGGLGRPLYRARIRTVAAAIASLVLCSAACADSSGALSPGHACPGSALTVFAADPHVADQVCDAAAASEDLLTACGLPPTGPLKLTVVPEIEGAPEQCLGIYHCETHEIAVIAPEFLDESRLANSIFAGLDVDIVFAGLVVHEISHARTAQAHSKGTLSTASHEYVAYAMQLSAMPEAARTQLLGDIPDGPADEAALNELVLGLKPERFIGLTWRHFVSPGHGCSFVRSLLAGSVSLGIPEID